MKALINFAVSVLLIQMSACAITPTSEQKSMRITSKEWFNPSFRDIYTTIDVREVNINTFVLDYSFSVPLDPQKGVDPSEMHIFTFCVASKLAKQGRKSHWTVGAYEKDKDMKYKNTRDLTFVVAALEKDEMAPSLVVNSQPIAWKVDPQDADKYFQACSRLIQEKYMWSN